MKETKQYSAYPAVEAAEGFLRTGLLVAPRSGWASSTSALADSPIGELTVGAVNLSFASELYLKALLLQLRIAPPRTHKLVELFGKLPDDIQELLHLGYVEQLEERSVSKGDFSIGAFFVSPDRDAMEKKASWADADNPTLVALLQSHQDAFMQWRYDVFELRELEFGMQFNFRAFGAFLEVVRDVAWKILELTSGIPDKVNRSVTPHWPSPLKG